MSFSYKTLNSNDITLTSYIANKQWEVSDATLYQNGITIYVGENLPITKDYPFDPIDDSQTSNEEYRRLIFDSIKNLYYQNYISGSLTGKFFNSSSIFNYEQSTLTSGSMLAANRNLPTITGSYLDPNNPTVFDSNLYDISSSLYDEIIFDPDIGSKIVVLSIDQNIFGSGLSPNTFAISGSTYHIADDGEGNLYDTLATSSLYVGNIFYSQGLVVLTHQDYLCLFGVPPTTKNDYFTYQNTDYLPQSLSILANDFADCNAIDPNSVNLTPVYGYTFPDHSLNLGTLMITPNQTSVIPGNYKLEYVVENYTGLISNTSSINLTVTALDLEISNIISSSTCYNSASILPVTFSINYGVPYYSYSLDNGATYTGVPGFFNQTISGSITASNNNTIQVTDYTGNIYTSSFSSWYPEIIYTAQTYKGPCNSTGSDGKIIVTRPLGLDPASASLDNSHYNGIPYIFTGLTTGSYTIYVKDSNNCVTSSIVNLNPYTPLTASITQSSTTCYGNSNGTLSVAFTNVIDLLYVTLLDPTSSFIYNNVLLSSFPNNVVTASNLITGSYDLSLTHTGTNECQTYNNILTLTSPTQITFSPTASYIDSCSNAIILNVTGGIPPYTYLAFNTGSGTSYSNTSNSISLDGLNPGVYGTLVLDSLGCVTPTTNIEIFERTYHYTGSYCVTSSGQITGYVSSSGIEQNFTSGIFSGSLVTSSYSNGTTLFGPTINYTQLFTSGTVDSIFACNIEYLRYYLNTTQCTPSASCVAPIITSVTPTGCLDINNKFFYNVAFTSASNSAYSMSIEYSLYPDFNGPIGYKKFNLPDPIPVGAEIIRAFGGAQTPNNHPLTNTFDYQNQLVYFRAYNSCSNGFTSSYSNVVYSSCNLTAIESPISIEIHNNSGNSLKYSYNSISYNLLTGATITIDTNIASPTSDLYINIIGNSIYGSNKYLMGVSSTDPIDGNISTLITPQFETSTYPPVLINNNYAIPLYVPFKSDGALTTTTNDVWVHIDKSLYNDLGATIVLNISPTP